MKKNRTMQYTLAALLCIFIDRITKYIVMYKINYYRINFFTTIDLVFNRGISFGLFHSDSINTFAIINVVIACVIMALFFHGAVKIKEEKSITGETLIFAGALSNVADRYLYGGVVDFIACAYQGWYFPVFNGADIFIVVGVFIMLFSEYKASWKK